MPKQNKQQIFNQINDILNSETKNSVDDSLMHKIAFKKSKQADTHTKPKGHAKHAKSVRKVQLISFKYMRMLIDLYHKKNITIRYYDYDKKKLATTYYLNNFICFRTLANLKLVKLIHVKDSNRLKCKYLTISLTKLGHNYMNKLIPNKKYAHFKVLLYFIIYKILSFAFVFDISIFLMTFFFLGALSVVYNNMPHNLFITIIAYGFIFSVCAFPILFVLHGLESNGEHLIEKLFKKHYFSKLCSKSDFVNFLRRNNVKQPSVNFKYDKSLPKLTSAMFKKHHFKK